MEDFDDEAEKQIEAEYGSDSDSYTMLDAFVKKPKIVSEIGPPETGDLFSQVEADIHDEKEVAPTNDRSHKEGCKTCSTPKNCGHDCKKKLNPKDSSDEECMCKAPGLSANEKVKVIEIQNRRKSEAAAAKKKADELRKKAEEAINAANEARMAAVSKAVELSKKAQEATEKAETSVVKQIRKQSKANQKVSVFRGENFDLRTKRMTK